MKNTIGKITTKQLHTMDKSARRAADIEFGVTPFKHKVHKSKKAYNRTENKRIEF